jgi:hypothetical protein
VSLASIARNSEQPSLVAICGPSFAAQAAHKSIETSMVVILMLRTTDGSNYSFPASKGHLLLVG